MAEEVEMMSTAESEVISASGEGDNVVTKIEVDEPSGEVNQEDEKEAEATSKPLTNGVKDLEENSAEDSESSTELKESTPADEKETVVEEEVPNEQELKYWKTVNENPQDFTSWTYLLQFVEQENKLSSARKAFEAFFKRYPYCYGYWKKFADLEKRNGNVDKAKEVFESGVAAIPLSVDLWVHYLNFASQSTKGQADGPSIMRRAVDAAGEEFRADKLWEAYIEWEKSQNKLGNVTALYDRLLRIPTQQYSKHYDKFRDHINTNAPSDILDTEELLKLRAEIGAAPPGVDSDAAVINIAPDVAPPGEEENNSEETEPEAPGEEVHAVKTPDDVETTAIREKVIAARQIIYLENEEEVRKRWSFEEAIKRPYFHVKPLERVQLKNWREYLDFEVSQDNLRRIVILFERCMIACALYEDFWQKYASYIEPNDVDRCRNVYERACNIHLPRKVNIHLSWAAFEEQNGDASKSASILENIEKAVPGYTMLRMKRISLERRCGSNAKVMELYDESIKQSDSQEVVSYFAIKCARFLSRVMKDLDSARKVLKDALENDKSNKRLYLQLLDLELHNSETVEEEKVEEVFDLVKDCEHLSAEVKQGFSQRRLEFLEDYSTSVDKIMKAYDNYQKQYKVKPAAATTGKKRSSDSEADTKSKSLKTDETVDTTQTSTAGDTTQQDLYSAYSSAYSNYYSNPSAHSQWAGYSSQPGYNYNAWYQQHYGNSYGQTTQ